MSLLFERALGSFSPSEARHLRTSREALDESGSSPVSLGDLARLASNRSDVLEHPDRERWLCVPLHGEDSAELDGEYVVYEDHPLRGDVFIYLDSATGDPEPIDRETAEGTVLGRRLRFWTTDFDPDERPSYATEGPTTHVPPANPIPEDDRGGYFDRLAQFIEDERRAERERNRERARRHTPRELAAQGESAVPELTGFARTADGAYQFRAVTDDTRGNARNRFHVFEGDEVLLCAPGDAPADFPVPATVERIVGYSIDLRPSDAIDDPDAVAAFLETADGVGLSPLLNPVSYDRESDAVRSIRDDDRRRSLVVGGRAASFAGDAARNTTQRDGDLDDSQALAATCALYAEDVCCVHGPPGTGKTRTLVEIVRRAVADGERVLVCADSNQGVDNVVVGTSTRGSADEGSLHYYATAEDEFTLDRHREDHSDYELVRETYADVPGRPDVVASTNNSAADFEDDSFDLAVVDEATQATTQSAFVPFTKAERLIVAGDHKQLPPFESTETPAEDERHRSLFEHFYTDDGIYGGAVGVQLTTQYRMHPEIAAFPNRAFYGGRLENGRTVEPIDDLPPLVGVDVDGEERADETHSYSNPEEAAAVGRLVDRLLDAGVAPAEVGVITPYRAQVDAVESELRDRSADVGDVEVDTVDSFQGSEREAVVISFVRSNDRGEIGFLGREPDGPRRLNVALTRAERFCGLVADWDALRTEGDGTNACAHLYRDLYDQLVDAGRMRAE